MAYQAQTHTVTITERLLAGIAQAFGRAAERHAHYRVYRESLFELRALSDRELSDIGLSRSVLKSIALETADRQVPLN